MTIKYDDLYITSTTAQHQSHQISPPFIFISDYARPSDVSSWCRFLKMTCCIQDSPPSMLPHCGFGPCDPSNEHADGSLSHTLGSGIWRHPCGRSCGFGGLPLSWMFFHKCHSAQHTFLHSSDQWVFRMIASVTIKISAWMSFCLFVYMFEECKTLISILYFYWLGTETYIQSHVQQCACPCSREFGQHHSAQATAVGVRRCGGRGMMTLKRK